MRHDDGLDLESLWRHISTRGKDPAEITRHYINLLSRFPRPAGTSLDKRSAELIRGEFENVPGFETEVERFSFMRHHTKDYSMQLDGSDVDSRPCLCSRNTPKNGTEGPVVVNTAKNLEDKIVLIPIVSLHESIEIERVAKKGAVGALVFQINTPLLSGRTIYPSSTIPAVCIDGSLGKKLLNDCNKRTIIAKFRVRSSLVNSTGVNIYSLPKRTTCQKLFVAHRDSREFSPGAIDNASGTSLLIHLARNRDPSLAYGLFSTDAEEYGLLGAKHFLKSNKYLYKGCAVINMDSIGTGSLHLITRSRGGPLSKTLNRNIRKIAREKLRYNLGDLTTLRGSDSDVFQIAGYETAWIRSYPTPSATTIQDSEERISQRELRRACRLVSTLSESRI